ncbi:hypothetical protein IGK38_001214 [Enterococcus pernyi]
MYFQNLENLKSSIPKFNIENLDYWLGSMSPIYYKKINPKEFAIRYGMDIESAFNLFDLAVEKNILKPKIIVVDDNSTPFGTFYDIDKVPETIDDFENNISFKVEKHNMEIWYELIEVPKEFTAPVENNYLKSGIGLEERPTLEILERAGAANTLKKLRQNRRGLKNWRK